MSAPLRLRTADDGASPLPLLPPLPARGPSIAKTGDAIDAWLAMFVRLLHWPASDTQAVVDELDAHLRERARDLMLEGQAESDALRAAIAELGEAAILAQRYRSARRYTIRRFLMNASVFVLAGAALGLSIVAISGGTTHPSPTPPPVSRARPESAGATERDPAASQPERGTVRISVFAPGQEESAAARTPITGDFQNLPLREVFTFLGTALNRSPVVQWSRLEAEGISPDAEIGLKVKDTPLATVFRLVGESLGAGNGSLAHLAFRVDERLFEVSTQADFDRRELVLVCYDLSRLDDEISIDSVPELLQTFVEPAGWKNNGGELGEIRIAGRRMFVQAPKRYHRQIEWFLAELTLPPDERSDAGPGLPLRALAAATLARQANLTLDVRPVVRDSMIALEVQPVLANLDLPLLVASRLRLASPCPPEEVEPGQTRVYRLQRTVASGLAALLQRLVACEHPDGSLRIACDAHTNSLVVIGTLEQQAEIKSLIAGIDGDQ